MDGAVERGGGGRGGEIDGFMRDGAGEGGVVESFCGLPGLVG